MTHYVILTLMTWTVIAPTQELSVRYYYAERLSFAAPLNSVPGGFSRYGNCIIIITKLLMIYFHQQLLGGCEWHTVFDIQSRQVCMFS